MYVYVLHPADTAVRMAGVKRGAVGIFKEDGRLFIFFKSSLSDYNYN